MLSIVVIYKRNATIDKIFFRNKNGLMEKMLTPQDVANKLGLTVYRVHQLIRAGRLPATAYGRFYLISEADLALVAERKAGRPKKEGAAAVANGATGAKATARPSRKATKKGATK